MAILDRKIKSRHSKVVQPEADQPFAEISAKKLAHARRDSNVQKLLAAAERHMESLRASGRID